MKRFVLALVALFCVSNMLSAQLILANPPPNRYPTHMTSINYPTIYGAYETFPVPKTSFSTPYSTSPEWDLNKDIRAEKARYLKMVSPKFAKIIVVVPTKDSTVEVQGTQIEGTGYIRSFVSPDLEDGKDFVYTVTVRWNDLVDGKSQSLTKKMYVRAGGRAMETFNPWEARQSKKKEIDRWKLELNPVLKRPSEIK